MGRYQREFLSYKMLGQLHEDEFGVLETFQDVSWGFQIPTETLHTIWKV